MLDSALQKHLHWDFVDPTKKPVGPVEIDWSNPITRGLTACVFMLGGKMVELVTQTPSGIAGGAVIAFVDGNHVLDGDGDGTFTNFGDIGNVTTDQLTVMSRHQLQTASNREWLVFKGDVWSNNEGYALYHWLDDYYYFDVHAGGIEQAQSNATYSTTGVWNDVCGVYDGVNNWVEVNGTAGSNNAASGSITNSTDNFAIGASHAFSNYGLLGYEEYGLVWNRALSEAERISMRQNPYQILKPRIPQLYLVPSAGGGGTLTPSGIASAEAIGSPTITTGGVNVSPNGIASLEAFGSPVLSQATYLLPSAIGSAEAFGSVTVVPGSVTLAVTGIASLEAFGTTELLTGLLVEATGIATGEAFGSPTISVGPVTITITGIPTAEAFGSVTLPGFEGDVEEYRAMIRNVVRDMVRDAPRDIIIN